MKSRTKRFCGLSFCIFLCKMIHFNLIVTDKGMLAGVGERDRRREKEREEKKRQEKGMLAGVKEREREGERG